MNSICKTGTSRQVPTTAAAHPAPPRLVMPSALGASPERLLPQVGSGSLHRVGGGSLHRVGGGSLHRVGGGSLHLVGRGSLHRLRPTALLMALMGAVLLAQCVVQGQLMEEEEGISQLRHSWQMPGCHRVGHTRRISIPECVEFEITTNACRGFCESWSILSNLQGLAYNPQQRITSVGQCCNIMANEDVKVKVMCVNGPRELVFKSAKTCSCFHCKKY